MKKILIVDDSVFIRDVFKDVLDKDKFEFFEANDGIEALEVFKNEKPDLVILDILMPNMDGVSAFKVMKEINSDSKVLFITAVEKDDVEDKLGEFTVDGFITKPFDVNSLIDLINKIVRA